ncbi:hypothetical protein C8R46DRAFT_1024356 [Mycena filopes]|nr:hypothetical protein C8R46DRAFT_1024356 [Mycena filopes]
MAVSNPGINLILGPVILGILINTFVFGIVFMQGITYYTGARFKQDRPVIKLLVGWALLLDVFHSGAIIWVIWEYCINHFGDTEFLGTTPWPYPTTPIFSSSASVPIQIFLAWRVKRLSKSYPIFVVLCALSVASGIMAWISAIRALQASNIKARPLRLFILPPSNERTPCIVGLRGLDPRRGHLVGTLGGVRPFLDVRTTPALLSNPTALSLLLFLYLRRSRTGFAKTDNIITRLTVQSIETASFSTLNSVSIILPCGGGYDTHRDASPQIMDLICFTALQNTNFHFVFALMAGRMYTNTLLATLNSREKLREDMSGINTITSPPLSRGVAVHVSVEQRQEMGSGTELDEIDHKGSSPRSTSKGNELNGGNTYYV